MFYAGYILSNPNVRDLFRIFNKKEKIKMILLKIILLVIGFIISSLWLTVLIASGVKMGLKNYFDESSKGGR